MSLRMGQLVQPHAQTGNMLEIKSKMWGLRRKVLPHRTTFRAHNGVPTKNCGEYANLRKVQDRSRSLINA